MKPSLRTLLTLGRVSNLPTVWSNCLAGWCLGGQGNVARLPWLMVGATLLYVGGMFLNDAFDADFDAQFRRERPIPSGAISARAVWWIGAALLLVGLVCLFVLGTSTGIIGGLLVVFIVAYDAVHKLVKLSPVLMAGCRFLLYPLAASAAVRGVTGESVWCGFALGAYVMGVSYLAGKESKRGDLQFWPCWFLTAPVVLAVEMNGQPYFEKAMLVSLVLGLWVIRCLRYTLGAPERNVGRTVAGLLAGIVWVDLLAVADVGKPLGAAFIGLFLLALFLQRFVPAT